MKKRSIRSIRFSEGLVTRCMWELPERERQLAELDRQIAVKRKELMRLNEKAVTLGHTLSRVEGLVANIQTEIIRAVKGEG